MNHSESSDIKKNISTVLLSTVLLGRILSIRDLYSSDLDHDELRELLEKLNKTIKEYMKHPIWKNFRADFNFIPYETKEFPKIINTIVHSSINFLKESQTEKDIKKILEEADKQILQINDRLNEIYLFECRIPNPEYDVIYRNPKRHFYLFKTYWSLYRRMLEVCGTSPLGYRPHPLRKFIANFRYRIEHYIEILDEPELNELYGEIDTLNPIVSEDFSIDWECGGIETANLVDNAIENLSLKYGTQKFNFNVQENYFIETSNEVITQYRDETTRDFQNILKSLDKRFEPDTEFKTMHTDLNEDFESEVSSEKIISEIDFINRWSNEIFGNKLLIFQEQRTISDLLSECKKEDDFNKLIACLNNILDWMSADIFRDEKIEEGGSIRKLELLLEKYRKGYNKEVFLNFRLIKKLRRKYPFHTDSEDFKKALEKLNMSYPVKSWESLCKKVKGKFLYGLKGLRKDLSEIKKLS